MIILLLKRIVVKIFANNQVFKSPKSIYILEFLVLFIYLMINLIFHDKLPFSVLAGTSTHMLQLETQVTKT